jgi:hypothetical protein
MKPLAVVLSALMIVSFVPGSPATSATLEVQTAVFTSNSSGSSVSSSATGFSAANSMTAESILNNSNLGVLSDLKMTFGDSTFVSVEYIYDDPVNTDIVFGWNGAVNIVYPITFTANVNVDFEIDCSTLVENAATTNLVSLDGSAEVFVRTVMISNCTNHYIKKSNGEVVNGPGATTGIWAVSIPRSDAPPEISVGGNNIGAGTPINASHNYYFENYSASGGGGGGPGEGGPGNYSVSLSNYFVATGFSKGKAKLTDPMKAFIRKELQNSGTASKVVCTGTVRGKKWTESRQALAIARATSACDYVAELYPDAAIELKTRLMKKKKQDSLTVRISVFKGSYIAPPA